jgi:hypothetical protein
MLYHFIDAPDPIRTGDLRLRRMVHRAGWCTSNRRQSRRWASPPRSNRNMLICFNLDLYRPNNLVQRFFNSIKQYRRATVRHDKLTSNYLAFDRLASIRLRLRVSAVAPPGIEPTRASFSVGDASRTNGGSWQAMKMQPAWAWRTRHRSCGSSAQFPRSE